MENAQYSIDLHGTILYFDGCTLVNAEYEEETEEVEFGEDWFIDEAGERIDIVIKEDERHPYDESDSTLYAYVKIEDEIVKKLQIFKYASGTSYLEVDDN